MNNILYAANIYIFLLEMIEWRSVIPAELHEDFVRQVDEAVSAELMQIFIDCEDDPDVDDAGTESALTARFVDHYVSQFRQSLWPPKASAQLGMKAGSLFDSTFWICSACREKNPNSFETCRKCNEDNPRDTISERPIVRTVVRSLEPAPVVQPLPLQAATWTCKECSVSNPMTTCVCVECKQHQDAYKRTTWPPVSVVRDPVESKNLRMQLFNRIRAEFDMDDPFASIEISHEEFFQVVEKLKIIILDDHLASRSLA